MITRMKDYSCFNDKVFDELANKLNVKTNIKLAYNENKDKFKRVAWGEYVYAAYTGSNGYQEKYAFDDGAIWYIETDEQGNQYIVKQVDDSDEIVRVASNNIFINEHNLLKFASLLNVQGFNQDTLNFIKSDNNTLKATCQQMNNKLVDYIKNYATKNNYIEDKKKLKNTVAIISKYIDKLNNVNELNSLIDKNMK